MFSWFLYGELLVPVAQSYQGDAAAVLRLGLYVCVVDDDRG